MATFPRLAASKPRQHSDCRISAAAMRFGCALLLVMLKAGWLEGQSGLEVPIQLPTQSFFGVNTTVSVPDGGSISLGGNRGSAWGSTRRGFFGPPFANRASGGTQFANNATVHVQILSLSEMEAELLSQLPPEKSLADYLRPAPPKLWVRQSETFPETRLASSSSRPAHRPSSVPNASLNGQPATPSQTVRESAPHVQLVDPNGSRSVQDKADFMSRHMGRKKK